MNATPAPTIGPGENTHAHSENPNAFFLHGFGREQNEVDGAVQDYVQEPEF